MHPFLLAGCMQNGCMMQLYRRKRTVWNGRNPLIRIRPARRDSYERDFCHTRYGFRQLFQIFDGLRLDLNSKWVEAGFELQIQPQVGACCFALWAVSMDNESLMITSR